MIQEEMTPLRQAEQIALELPDEDDDDAHVIEESYEETVEEPVEEYIDITRQSEITDDDGIIRDDVIDDILSNVDELREE